MRSFAILMVCIWAIPGCAHVTPTHSWSELTTRLGPSQPVVVTDAHGVDARGQVSSVSSGTLTLQTESGPRPFEIDSVTRIRRDGDSLWNGLAIGAAVGVLGAILPDNKCSGQSVRCDDRQIPARITFFAASTAAGGVIDALHRDRTIVYERRGVAVRILPVISPGRRGITVAVTRR